MPDIGDGKNVFHISPTSGVVRFSKNP
jgi:hypothetical protein